MTIDYGFLRKIKGAIQKGTPHKAVIAKVRSRRRSADRKGTEKTKARSGGRCEVRIAGERCRYVASQTHHRLKGNGQRGRGESALAKHKTHACWRHHAAIEAGDLVHVRGNHYKRKAA